MPQWLPTLTGVGNKYVWTTVPPYARLVSRASPLPHGRVFWMSSTAVPSHWILQPNQRTVFRHVIHCRLMTKCKINNDVNCYDVSGELRVGCGKVWTLEQRVDTSFVRVCERKGCLSLAMPTGQITSKRAQGWCCLVVPWSAEKCQNTNMPCATTCCYHEAPGSLIWRAICPLFAGQAVATVCLCCTVPTKIIPVMLYMIQILDHWLHSGGIEYSVDP